VKPAGAGARLVNSALDVLSFVPYFRGKGTLALGALRLCGESARLTGRLPNGGRVLIGPDAMHQTVLPYWIGRYETGVVESILQTIRRLAPGSVMMDIGANLGFYTVLAATALREQGAGMVYSFEPNPPMFAELEKNVSLNDFTNVKLENIGIGDVNAEMPLFVKDYGPTVSSLRDMKGTLTDQVNIHVTTLDEYASSHRIENVGLLKVDVEGSELLVLRGALHLLARDRPTVVYEEFETAYQEFGYSIRDVREFLTALDYRLFAIPETNSRLHGLHELTVDDDDALGYQNVLAVPMGA
jgi:FkbM family methyltransferase